MSKQELLGHKAGKTVRATPHNQGQIRNHSPCFKCLRHPWYPDIPPVTLHIEGICAICGNYSK